jgi:KamA family protein
MNSELIFLNLAKTREPECKEHFKVYTNRQIDNIPQITCLPEEIIFNIKVVANVLPFRINKYVCDQLIDWDNWSNDPIFKLTFPDRDMLSDEDFSLVSECLARGDKSGLQNEVSRIRANLNPNPAGQMELNIPQLNGKIIEGTQHKYKETVLFFPSQGQVCHSYCSFCFRWSQFIGDQDLKFASKDIDPLCKYLKHHTEVTDVLITGGDPMVMKANHLAVYVDALLQPGLEHIQTIRIGTKSLTFWPFRYLTDDDADDVLRIFEKVNKSGKHLALMAHYNHWKELDTDVAADAIQRVQSTGAQIRSQGPLLAKINDSAEQWTRLWKTQVNLGIFPYYMFIERDTGARHYFKVPIYHAWQIYRDAFAEVPGIARTARGPSMSTEPGKIEIQGVAEIHNETVFVLRFIQARNPEWLQRPFFAKFDENAAWIDDLKPAFGEEQFFFEKE